MKDATFDALAREWSITDHWDSLGEDLLGYHLVCDRCGRSALIAVSPSKRALDRVLNHHGDPAKAPR